MKILVLDTSMEMGTVGIVDSATQYSQIRIDIKKGTTNTIHSQIERVLSDAGLSSSKLDLIGVVIGPGSFTGLRVSLSAAKGLAHPFSIPIVGIKSTEAIASMIITNDFISVIINARRSHFLRATYKRASNGLTEIQAPSIMTLDTVLDDIPDDAMLTGQGLKFIPENVLSDFSIAPYELWFPSVPTLARLALEIYSRGKTLDQKTSIPVYFRGPDTVNSQESPA